MQLINYAQYWLIVIEWFIGSYFFSSTSGILWWLLNFFEFALNFYLPYKFFNHEYYLDLLYKSLWFIQSEGWETLQHEKKFRSIIVNDCSQTLLN